MECVQGSVASITELGAKEKRLVIDLPEGTDCGVAGQFAMVEVPHEKTFLRRAISIARPLTNQVVLDVAMVGVGTESIGNLKEGDSINLILPLGRGFDLDVEGPVALVGGGVGRAPMYGLAEALLAKNIPVTLILGGRSKGEVSGLEALAEKAAIRYATEDGSLGVQGFVTEHLCDVEKYTRVYACGPTPMLRAVQSLCFEKNVPLQVSVETRMACGVGVCLGCTVQSNDPNSPYLKACKDGPVFWSEEVRFDG